MSRLGQKLLLVETRIGTREFRWVLYPPQPRTRRRDNERRIIARVSARDTAESHFAFRASARPDRPDLFSSRKNFRRQ